MPTVESYQEDPIHEDIRMFEMELKKKFPDLVVTSGYRPNAKTKQGNLSRHGKGEAIDLRYKPKIREYLWNTKEGVALLNKYELGFLDESDAKTMKRTGATGKHFHIGKDSTLVPKTKQRYQELWGQEYVQQPQTNINPQQTNFDNSEPFNNFGYGITSHSRLGTNLPEVKEVDKETPKKEENTSKEKEALLQKQKEDKFLQEYLSGNVERELKQRREEQLRAQQQAQQEQQPQFDAMQAYEEVSSFIENPIMQKGGTMVSKNGVFDSKGAPVIVPSNNITMQGVDYPILGISQETGERKIMLPDVENYFFKDTKNVLEIPLKNK